MQKKSKEGISENENMQKYMKEEDENLNGEKRKKINKNGIRTKNSRRCDVTARGEGQQVQNMRGSGKARRGGWGEDKERGRNSLRPHSHLLQHINIRGTWETLAKGWAR